LYKQYYVKAITSPLGQKVNLFYTDTSKQVLDIHEEARRIADHEKNEKLAAKETTQGASSSESADVASEKNSTPVN
jgi:hypothetical protein